MDGLEQQHQLFCCSASDAKIQLMCGTTDWVKSVTCLTYQTELLPSHQEWYKCSDITLGSPCSATCSLSSTSHNIIHVSRSLNILLFKTNQLRFYWRNKVLWKRMLFQRSLKYLIFLNCSLCKCLCSNQSLP